MPRSRLRRCGRITQNWIIDTNINFLLRMAKEKSIAELKDQLGKCAEERSAILDAIKAESRKATDEETRRLGEIASRQAGLEFEIKLAEARNKYTGEQPCRVCGR